MKSKKKKKNENEAHKIKQQQKKRTKFRSSERDSLLVCCFLELYNYMLVLLVYSLLSTKTTTWKKCDTPLFFLVWLGLVWFFSPSVCMKTSWFRLCFDDGHFCYLHKLCIIMCDDDHNNNNNENNNNNNSQPASKCTMKKQNDEKKIHDMSRAIKSPFLASKWILL